jgi:predicted phosphodiesterase
MDNVMAAMKNFYTTSGNEEYQRLVVHNGDWVSTDGESYWTDQWFNNYPDVVSFTASTPINGCKGNHDDTSGYTSGYTKYFPYPYVNLGGPAMLDGNGKCLGHTSTTTSYPHQANGTCVDKTDAGYNNPYYNNLYWSYDYGPVHFTVVDEYSDFSTSSTQYAWIQSDLAAAAANPNTPWKILVYHAPAYSAGHDADNTAVRILEPLITTYGVDLVYSGHSHNYARTGAYNSAQAGGDQIALNVPHFTNGGGGAPIYNIDMTNTGSYPHVITAWPAFEFMSFDVNGKDLTVTAYQVNNVDQSKLGWLPSNGHTYTSVASPTNLSLSPIETVKLHHYSNVSQQVTVSTSAFTYNRATQTYNGTMTVKNNGSALIGNVHVVMDGLVDLNMIGTADTQYFAVAGQATGTKIIATNPANGNSSPASAAQLSSVKLVNATGSNNGEPMIQVSSTGIAAGGSRSISVSFKNSSTTANIKFNPVTYQE